MQLPADTIVIADRSTAGKILCSARRRSGIGYLVSIGGAREREPAGFRHAPDRLRLVFEDAVTLEDGGPSLRDIGQLIHFARRVDLGRGRVLVHCQSGISRSSAELAERSSVPYGREQERAVQLTDESDERGAARSHVDGGENMGRMKAMEDEGLPCLELLEATPDILRGLMAELAEEDARWKPAEDRFSVAEVLAHLSHSEGDCYRLRLDRFLSEERPEFEPDDAQMYLDLYRNADPEDAFDHFEEQRENNVDYLRRLPVSAGDRKAIHKEYGEITLSQMLHEWALHDLGHIRQIAELVRARRYLGGAGPMGRGYQLRP